MKTASEPFDAGQPKATPSGVTEAGSPVLQDLAIQRDLNLRLTADFENFRRRSRLDADARAAAQKDAFIAELLPVVDNLERAVNSGTPTGSRQLFQGVEMTLQQLRQLLVRHEIECDDILGQVFDPNRHEAIDQHRDPTHPDRAVLEVVERGYRRGTRILRPARVVVNNLSSTEPARGDADGKE